MTEAFLTFACEKLALFQSILIDSPSLENPVLIQHNGQSYAQPPNQKGEGDHGVWLYAVKSPFTNVALYACDTDIWMISLALVELGHLLGKVVYVELKRSQEYVKVSEASNVLNAHPCIAADH